MSDFGGKPLVAGTITGVRSFAVDELNRLTGVSQPLVWRPSENVAKCCAAGPYAHGPRETTYAGFAMYTSKPLPESEEERAKRLDKHQQWKSAHRIAAAECSCGFYAYFDEESNPHHREGQVLGLIEAYGSVTVGSKGFRAEKAKILALIDTSATKRATTVRRTLKGKLPASVWWLTFALVLNLANVVFCGITWHPIDALISFGVAVFVAVALAASLRISQLERKLSKRSTEETNSIVSAAVRRNYPDVPVYQSIDEARAVFPLVQPEMPTPQNTPDFWDRSA